MKRACPNCGVQIDEPHFVGRRHVAVCPRCGRHATAHPERAPGENHERRVPRPCHPRPGTAAGVVEQKQEAERLREVMRERAYARRWHRDGPPDPADARGAPTSLKRLMHSRIPPEQLSAIAKLLGPVVAVALIHCLTRRPHDAPLAVWPWRR